MPTLMALTDTACRNAKATDKPQKLSDSGGAPPVRQPLWRPAMANGRRFDGKQKQLSFGAYPAISLWDERVRIMQVWADYLDELRTAPARKG